MTGSEAHVRRAAVVSSLRSRPGGVSGEDLADDLGISRAAVGKHVATLRRLGYSIDATPGRGYRLVSAPDAPIPYEVEPLLAPGTAVTLVGGGPTGSTNDDARALAAAGAPAWTVVLASEQTAGRGRLGRTWSSPPGGVYLSIVLRPAMSPAEAGTLPLAVGLGVGAGLERVGVQALLKWPNDVVILSPGGRFGKLAGVLLESMTEGERISWVVAGIGVNVERRAAPAPEPAAHLDDLTGRHVPLAVVAAAVLAGVESAVTQLEAEGFGSMADEYDRRSALLGHEVTVRDREGRKVAEGHAAGIDLLGRLLVESGGRRVEVSAGDVTLRG